MPRLTIDHQPVEVPEDATILDAARKLGINIPTLCFLDGHPANTSCMLCLVKVGGRWLPSCAAPAEDGMKVESETGEVRSLRRTGLELVRTAHRQRFTAAARPTELVGRTVARRAPERPRALRVAGEQPDSQVHQRRVTHHPKPRSSSSASLMLGTVQRSL